MDKEIWKMKIAKFTIQRNQIIDLINNLKEFLKMVDNKDIKQRFIACNLLEKKASKNVFGLTKDQGLLVIVQVDRQTKEKKV
jgi:cytoplasmic iron level regulating protein YaaA (DUF328/UPF0246 family)